MIKPNPLLEKSAENQPSLHIFFLDYLSWLFDTLAGIQADRLTIYDFPDNPGVVFASPKDEFILPNKNVDRITLTLLSSYIRNKVLNYEGISYINHDGQSYFVVGVFSLEKEFSLLHMRLLSKLDAAFVNDRKSGILLLDDMPDYQRIDERLKELDSVVGSKVSHIVRKLFPELAELERAEAEGHASWVSRINEGPAQEAECPPVPEKAPALWAEAKEPGDTPPAFIERHYTLWLGQGLTRADLRRLDPQLYTALANWLRKNELPEGFDLPTKSEQLATDARRFADSPEATAVRRLVYRLDKRLARER